MSAPPPSLSPLPRCYSCIGMHGKVQIRLSAEFYQYTQVYVPCYLIDAVS